MRRAARSLRATRSTSATRSASSASQDLPAPERALRPDRAPAPTDPHRTGIPVVREGVEVPARRSPEQLDEVRLGVSGDLADGRDAFVAADVALA
jgi:hypothetical protein